MAKRAPALARVRVDATWYKLSVFENISNRCYLYTGLGLSVFSVWDEGPHGKSYP